jgi:hypothetical protein
MKSHFYAIIVGLILFTSCDSEKKMKITIESTILLKQIPSASGIEFIDDKFWVVGDNSPWLFELNQDFFIQNKYPIFSLNEVRNNILPKNKKHDFEASTSIIWQNDSALFVFGSGSKLEQRNYGRLIQFGLEPSVTEFDLIDFYSLIKEKAKLDEDEFNLEAAAVLEDKLYLFNRGNNKIISMKINDFIEFIKKENNNLKLKVNNIDLPSIEGVQAGFSGATTDVLNGNLIFTASVENTSDWVKDGAVLGSYIGVIEIDKLQDHYIPLYSLLSKNGEPALLKVESIAVVSSENKTLNCVMVTDSDGGNSELLNITIEY